MKFLEEKTYRLFRLGTESWVCSTETSAGELVQFAYDVNSCGIVLGIVDATVVLVMWSREPSFLARTISDAAEQLSHEIDAEITAAMENMSPDEVKY